MTHPSLTIPADFARGVRQERGERAERWLAALPSCLHRYCERWGLEIQGQPWHGYLALVFPVTRGQELAVLKLTWVDLETRDESLALRLWDGRGAVRLLEADPDRGILLLERLQHDHSLAHLEINRATTIAAELLRRLAVPAPQRLIPMAEYARRQSATLETRWLSQGRPFPSTWLEASLEIPQPLQQLVVNQDLHFQNVLAGEREPWLVIDPKVVAGDPEFGVAPLLWNRSGEGELVERFESIVEAAKLERQRARQWSLLRCVDYWLWALESGLSEDPLHCHRVVKSLLP